MGLGRVPIDLGLPLGTLETFTQIVPPVIHTSRCLNGVLVSSSLDVWPVTYRSARSQWWLFRWGVGVRHNDLSFSS